MKLQDKYLYDSAIVGLNNLYCTVGADSFYINSPCILAYDKTISTGKTYILVNYPKGTGIKMSDVKLLDGYFEDGVINLIVQDIISQRIFAIDQCIECAEKQCTWVLVDLDYFIDRINAGINKSCYGKC
jgi:hypothetical protein